MIKNTIDKLVDSAEASEEDILELKKSYVNPEKNESIPMVNEDIEVTPIPDESQSSKKSISIFDEPLDTTLTSLPPKPASFQTKSKSEIDIPKFDDSRKLIARSKSKKKPKKSELLSEKKSLENKINSVKNLIEFVEKKHEAGDLDDGSFKKRINQLKSDLKKTQNKIDEINKML